jgi:hypothetical protein
MCPLVSEWQPSDPVQILVYGASKTGKTAGAITAPRPVVFDFDRGIATARGEWFINKYGMRWIFYETFHEKSMIKGVPLAHNAFDDACRFFDEWMKPSGRWQSLTDGKKYDVGREQFDTWVIDSGTTLSEVAMTKAVMIMGKMGLSKTQAHGISEGIIIPKVQDYGSERSLVEQFIDMVKTSGKNLILLCHEKTLMKEDSDVVTAVVPMLTGQSAEKVPLKFDEVYNLRIKQVGSDEAKVLGTTMKRYLQTEADGLRKVGSRYGIPNESLWNWDTVQKALTKIKETQRSQTPAPLPQGKVG